MVLMPNGELALNDAALLLVKVNAFELLSVMKLVEFITFNNNCVLVIAGSIACGGVNGPV